MTWIRDIELAGGAFWTGTALAVGLLVAVCLSFLARGDREQPSVSRKTARLLLALRLLAVGLLALLLAEPVVGRVVLEPAKGRVIVGVDVSDSMSTVDRNRPPAESARLAGLLKGAGAEAFDPLAAPRREIVRGLLEGPASPLARLAEDHELAFYAFARSMVPTSPSGIVAAGSGSGALDGSATDWRPLLAEAARPEVSGRPPTVGVVLVGDGRSQAASGPDKAGSADPLAELSRRKIPVFPLLIGSESTPSDLAIAALQAPETAFLDDSAPVEAHLESSGYAGRDLAVTLEARPAGKPAFVATKTVRPSTDRERLVVRFEVPLPAPGAVPLTVRVAPLVGEARSDNNAMERTIEVTGEPARVLVIDGGPRWEFRYLRNALARDPRVKVESVVFQQPKPELPAERPENVPIAVDPPTYGIMPPGFDPKAPGAAADAHADSDPFGRYDAIVLGDFAPGDVPPGFWDRLETHVSERAGTLIVAPGPVHWNTLWGGAGDDERASAMPPLLAALAPLTALRLATIDTSSIDPERPTLPPGVAILPTSEALAERSAWPMFRLTDTTEAGAVFWAKLPRQPWALVGRPKPGATVLAVSGPTRAGGSNSESDTSAVMAVQPFGLGRVFWIGTDGTWRWRYRVGDALHHRFWGQTVRWAAASARLTAGNERIRFGPNRSRIEAGEPVRIRARIAETAAETTTAPVLAARVSRRAGEGGESLVELRALPGQPRTFEGEVPPLEPGRYAIRLQTSGLGEREPVHSEAPLEVVPRQTRERIDLAASRDLLEPLARATGGAVVRDFEAETLPERLRPFARTVNLPRARVVSLWDRPLTLLAIVAVLASEWIVRKRVGLA